MGEKAQGKRRHSRLMLPEPIGADVTARYEVRILDLSQGGARLENTTILRPGDLCFLRFQLTGEMLTVTSRVVWSNVVGRTQGLGSPLLFQTGLAFEAMPEAAQTRLREFLATQAPSLGDSSLGWIERPE